MDTQQINKIIEILGPLRVFENESLSKHTYFKIGGPAKLFFETNSIDDLRLALKTACEANIPYVVLGGGANVLVSEKGFAGLVIKNKASAIKLIGVKGTIGKNGRGIKSALVWSASGTLMNQLARFTIDQSLKGLEFLLSVPGTVGGGIKINAHFEVEKNEFIGNMLVSAALFDTANNTIKNVDKQYFEFSYDHSKIQNTNEVVLEAVFKLEATLDKEALWAKAMDDVKRRNLEQPIGIACSGCIFRNISNEDAIRLNTPNLTGSTGYIIEKLGLKGLKMGAAQISPKHANYILNLNEASSDDVLKLINLIKTKAKQNYNLDLKEEIFYIGDF
ncbi:UDP-N-acetylenolpyruvoylglucosamine reductase [Candidatus Curtissbacteria bacterium RIFCSPHIGHO2_12_FULL_38_9b]|uniref:UDP-N-acetylenolpyruvoylglucosamine reductase n=1 Tax=Candidatus Curtissbacteria bacterium RIFCSPHIGHO2_12_FULL_38_9b TaxID=1797720 RepID=A0A1F5GU59_9BACT|nr:MAG: UDP-N-acetylenolpyruvoylglucosamine reductase [Candidatus Curtissbacteria bacterium RIFCSPHIGHO2_12_FULL_38_9b]